MSEEARHFWAGFFLASLFWAIALMLTIRVFFVTDDAQHARFMAQCLPQHNNLECEALWDGYEPEARP